MSGFSTTMPLARRRGAALATACLLMALSGPALAQSANGRGPISFQSIFDNFPTGSIARAPTTQPTPSPKPAPQRRPSSSTGWSGQDGASGHPTMTAAAIRRAAANFPRCVAAMWPDAARRNVSRESFARFTAGLSPDLRLMDLMDSQPEFTKAVWDYLDILVNDTRIARGREVLAQHRAVFDAVERAYGVDRYVIAAIWGIESNYSTRGGDRSVLNSTATLACIGRRQKYFKDEFIAALEILHRGDIRSEQLRGSWAGAFGGTQFMPTSFRRHAVDFDGDGRRDLVGSPADIIASTANLLKTSGWQAGETWGYEVRVPPGFNYMLADRSRTMTLAQWQRLGVRRATDRAFPRPHDKAYLLAPAGASGPAFLMLRNFRAIMRYNPAEAYALAIGHFADRLRGGAPFVQAWPRDQRVLSRAERLEMQQLLARAGYYRGEADGRFGSATRQALRGFQAAAGMPADGFATAELLDRLRRR